MSGTSMSTPHLAGAVALIWSAAPSLIGDIEGTRELFNESAVDQSDLTCGGTPENNNVFGEGRLDVLAAANAAPIGDTGVISGTVTDKESGEPLAGATVVFSGASDRDTVTDSDGEYHLTLATGDYDVTVTAFGYVQATKHVTIEDGETTTLNFKLTLAETYSLAGKVMRKSDKAPLKGSSVTIEGTPFTELTNKKGKYKFPEVPAGTYDVTVVPADQCLVAKTKTVVIDGVRDGKDAASEPAAQEGNNCQIKSRHFHLSLRPPHSPLPIPIPVPVPHSLLTPNAASAPLPARPPLHSSFQFPFLILSSALRPPHSSPPNFMRHSPSRRLPPRPPS
jgi:hypothetical protein